MDKTYHPQSVEDQLYEQWEEGGYFRPEMGSGLRKPQGQTPAAPFSIIMPPPNANAALHIGHAMFLTIEDILARFHRMKGDMVLWLPGADHAGILTQVVFERHLEKQGKSRFDLGREEFYRQCFNFTQENKQVMYAQMKKIGASCDWSREKFTLDPEISETVLETFVRLYRNGLAYRGSRMINWCPRCMTALADLEVEWIEQKDPLYFMKYGPFILATTRPETKFGDTALAVNPSDKRYQQWVGQEVEAEGLLGKFKIKVIADDHVDPKFGTGVVKVTPAHDRDDFTMGQRHKLEIRPVIDFNGRLNQRTGAYSGLTVAQARHKVAEDLDKKGFLVKVQTDYQHRVARCERCKTVIEPMVSLQWFIKTKPLAQAAVEAVKKGEIKIVPARFKKVYFDWMERIEDWCVSRQLWWGHRMPVWYCGTRGLSELQKSMNPELIQRHQEGCGEVLVQRDKPEKCPKCGNSDIIQDPDTFDTWFSSAQWPYTTLGFKWDAKSGKDFAVFYPTSVMETGYEILFFWVARMIMMGLYSTKKVPFTTVYLHGLVRDAFGQKMSKSKGNVLNPLDVISKYGADSLRLALVWGIAPGNDSHIGDEKIRGMRNFANKLWNIGRFIDLQCQMPNAKCQIYDEAVHKELKNPNDKRIISELNMLVAAVTKNMENYRFSEALQRLYDFTWHRLADVHLEKNKDRFKNGDPQALGVLVHVFQTLLKLLHPFAPFVTERLWQTLGPKVSPKPLIVSTWPGKSQS